MIQTAPTGTLYGCSRGETGCSIHSRCRSHSTLLVALLVVPLLLGLPRAAASSGPSADAEAKRQADVESLDAAPSESEESPPRREARGSSASSSGGARFVIPSGQESRLRELLAPLLGEHPSVSVIGVSVESSVITISLVAEGFGAEVTLHHAAQAPRRGRGRFRALPAAGLVAEVSCPTCSEQGFSALDELLGEADEPGWKKLWRDTQSASALAGRRGHEGPKSSSADELRRRSLVALDGIGRFVPASIAVIVLLFILLDSRRRGLPLLPIERPPPSGIADPSATGGRLRWYDLVALGAVLVAAAWPMLNAPMVGAGLIRLHDLSHWPFEDTGQPFLSFLLIRPFAAISLEPWLVRLPLLGFLLLNVVLVAVLAAKIGGRWAGLLAGAWMVCQAPRHSEISDIAGWHLGGFFVLMAFAWLLWAEERGHQERWKHWIVLGLILFCGVHSSWLFLVPAGVATFSVLILALRGSLDRYGAGAILLLFLALSIRVVVHYLGAFAADTTTAHPVPTYVPSELLVHNPIGLGPWIIIPTLAGFAWLLSRYREPRSLIASATFLLLCGPMVALAILTMGTLHWVSGGYYLRVVAGAAILIPAVGAGFLLSAIDNLVGRPTMRRLAGILGFIAMALATIRISTDIQVPETRGMEHLLAMDTISAESGRPILSNRPDLALQIAYERGRAGEPWGYSVRDEIEERTALFDDSTCDTRSAYQEYLATRGDGDGGLETERPTGYLVVFVDFPHINRTFCMDQLEMSCRRLFDEELAFNYFDCEHAKIGDASRD